MGKFSLNFASLALFLFLISLPLTSQASNNISVLSWKENTNLTTSGKISETLAQGLVKNLGQNQFMTAFSIGFGRQRNIKITDVICDGQQAQYSFVNGTLKIQFPKEKANGSAFSFYFAYEETYAKVEKFLREEVINIPDFAAGANSEVVINFPGYLESATLNLNVVKENNKFIYRNKVPITGVQEIIKLTPLQSVWDVNVKAKILTSQGLSDATVSLPIYFQNGGQKVENSTTTSSTQPIKQIIEKDRHNLKFNTPNKIIIIESKARISTGKNNRLQITRNPSDYLEVSPQEAALLTPILDYIQRNPKYQGLPLYAKIGKYVHEFINYDISYTGKLPSLKEILKNPVGVCSEYALLFNALARTAKIPSINVEGGACGEYDKCLGHAWNIIYYNGKWIDVDPTWDLMSGVVSSSHVYFNEFRKGGITVEYFDAKESVSPTMDFEMKNIL